VDGVGRPFKMDDIAIGLLVVLAGLCSSVFNILPSFIDEALIESCITNIMAV